VTRQLGDGRECPEFDPDANRPGFHSRVADYMADLAVCHLVQQREVLFTEQQITLDGSFLRFEGEPDNPALIKPGSRKA
jgi:hypothetical protein